MKKILMLSLSCNLPHFQALLGAVKDTWAKPLIQNKCPNIYWFGYTSCDNRHPLPCIDWDEHMIYVDCEDDLWHTYTKLKKAYYLIKEYIDFDFVVKTNTSLYINVHNMIKRINCLDDDMIIGRTQANIDYKDVGVKPYWQTMGYFIGCSKELFETSLSSDGDLINGRPAVDDHICALNISTSDKPFKIANIDDDPQPYVYYYIGVDDDTPNDIKTTNADMINHRVMMRVRPIGNVSRDNDGGEIDRLYELHNAMKINL